MSIQFSESLETFPDTCTLRVHVFQVDGEGIFIKWFKLNYTHKKYLIFVGSFYKLGPVKKTIKKWVEWRGESIKK